MFLLQRSILGKWSAAHPAHWRMGIAVCARLIDVSAYVLILRALGPRAFGIYAFMQWIATVAIPVIGVGTSLLAGREMAEIQSGATLRHATGIFYFLWYRQWRNIALFALVYGLLAFLLPCIFNFCSPTLMLIAALPVLPLLLSSVAGNTLRGLRRPDLLVSLRLFAALLSLLLVLLALRLNGERVGLFLLVSNLTATLTLIIAVICLMRLLPMRSAVWPGFFLRERLERGLKRTFGPFLSDAIVWQCSELLLLACWRPPAALGFYVLSSMISAAVLQFVPYLFFTWILPALLRYLPGYRYLSVYDAFVKMSCGITLLAIPVCALVMMCSPFIITCFPGAAYLPLMGPLRILLVATIFGCAATISLSYLLGEERRSEQVQLNAGAAIVNVVLAVPCVALWGVMGAALACAVAQIVSATGSILLCRKMLMRHEIRP